MQAELFLDAKAILGEGPAWDARQGILYWVDIVGKRAYAGPDPLTQLDETVGCLAPRKDGHLLLGKGVSLADLNPASGELQVLARLESEPPINRINDGKCDPAGRFLVGTMDSNEKEASGSLYSFDGGQARRLLDGIHISNGLAWSPDHQTFYYIDTPTRIVTAFDYDLTSGEIAYPRPAFQIPEQLGWPDGMTSDVEGNLWIAMWGGAQVTRWDPKAGQLLEQIPVPALHASSCVFGGRDMNELYVTSARQGLNRSDLDQYPHSGSLFRIVTKTEGMPTFTFG
ncbi:MAG: SMP-30/gluconolactonase/LRE family protein [Chloroflexi bacterium]|nr:SMP-30/gluconolactonase/LRE family protein [Chloroflexota bacterium]